jgi:antitoxin component YwqK of YwqJK toxin-antitoxin module
MKKILLIVAIMMGGFAFSQSNNPVLEEEGQLVKATYYYDNGKIQQVGYFKDGKLDGKWTSYEVNGSIKSVAEYTNGVKSGTWIINTNGILANEVDFSNNQVVAVRNIKPNGLAKN